MPAQNGTPHQSAVNGSSGKRDSPYMPKLPKLTVPGTAFFPDGGVVADEAKHADLHCIGVSFAMLDAMPVVDRINNRLTLN